MAGAVRTSGKGRFIVVNNPPLSASQSWPASTADYARLIAFKFRHRDDFASAIAVFHDKASPLYKAPFDIMPRHTVFVPEVAAALWVKRLEKLGVPHHRSTVIESEDLDAETIGQLRKEQYCP